MQKLYQLVRRYPLSVLLFLVVWYLSLFNPPEMPELEEVPFVDKWTHIAMYGGTCTVLWMEYLRSHLIINKVKLLVWAFAAPIAMSGVLELLQEYCTGGLRDGDWLDLLANSTGVTLAAVVGLLLYRKRPRFLTPR